MATQKSFPIGQVELVYAKAKVYVHPSKSSKDNIAGFLYIYRESSIQTNDKDLKFGWCAEDVLDRQQKDELKKVDLLSVGDSRVAQHYVKRPSGYGYFSFTTTIGDLFSIQIRPPSLGWWYGSVIINTRSASDKLPILFFHDDECPSTAQEQDARNKDFQPYADDNQLFWGGLQFMKSLKGVANIEKATLETSIYLVNPTLEDLNNFAPTNVVDDKAAKKEKFDFNKMVNDARWSFLETLAKVTTFTKKKVDSVLDDSPLPLKKILQNPDVIEINQEFDTARVYLAKWAMGVQEEANRNRSKIILNQSSRDLLQKELGINFDKLLPEEILNAHERSRPLTSIEWKSYFDNSGRLSITVSEVKDRIFHGGVEEFIRGEVWLFLLEVYPWDSSKKEREDLKLVLERDYKAFKARWEFDEALQQDEYFQDQKFRIEKDVQRTDRHLPIFKRTDDEVDESDVSKITNPHLIKVREILLTFNQYNQKLGYVQGMTDLLSPIYINMQDSSLAFWSFVKFMDRMERNFLHDQSGMKDQMNTLNELTQFLLPDLYIHLEKCDSNNLFFFFRMLLVWFKREFPLNEVQKIWEIFWTDYYTSQFHLFFALAILQKNEKIIIQHLRQFDEVLKYINDLSMTYKLDDLLTRGELLFLKFRKMVEIIDRDASKGNEDDDEVGGDGKSPISDTLRQLLSKKIVIKREEERHEG